MASTLYKLRYIIAIELFLLCVFAFLGFVTFAVLFSLAVLLFTLYFAFNSPIIAVHLLIFSILIDSLLPAKASSATPSILVAELFFVILLGLMTIKFLLNLEQKSKIPLLFFFWIPFLLWAFSGLLVSVDKLRVLTYWKNYFAGFFAFTLTLYSIKDKSHLNSLLSGIIIWGVALALIEIKVLLELGGFAAGIVGLFFKKNLLTVGWGRSNYLAAFFVIIIPFTIGVLYYIKSKKTKIILAIALALMAFAITLTLSRGGILALLIALIILFAKILKPRTIIPFIVVFVIIAVIVLLNPLTFVLIDRISSLETSGSLYSRLNFYEDTWNAFLVNPITGVGLGNLSYYATFILAPTASPSAHNIVLGALGETGIVGTFFYLATLTILIKEVFLNYRLEHEESFRILKWGCLSSLIGGLVHSLVEPTLDGLQFSIMFWTLAGISLNIDKLKVSN